MHSMLQLLKFWIGKTYETVRVLRIVESTFKTRILKTRGVSQVERVTGEKKIRSLPRILTINTMHAQHN